MAGHPNAAPNDMVFEFADLSEIPMCNEGLRQQDEPAAVTQLKQQILAADAVLMACPE